MTTDEAPIFQPEAKLIFVERFCKPRDGWDVFVDIDASEEGRTGGEPKSAEGRRRKELKKSAGRDARRELAKLGVEVGGSREAWYEAVGVDVPVGDRDIVAIHKERKLVIVAEVEAESTQQPEQKIAHAIGQLVKASSTELPPGYDRELILVVATEKMAAKLWEYRALERIEISGVSVDRREEMDRLAFGGASCLFGLI